MLSMAIDPRVNEAKHRHGWVHIDVCTVKSHLILDANTQCGEQSRSASQPGAAGRRGNDNLVQRLLDLTVEYVSEREQFGRPVGANQAVKHHCSNVAIALEFARPLVHVAAWTLATGRLPEGTVPPAPDPRSAPLAASVAASMAKAAVSDALDLACRSALQCHGAIGYTIEYDLQLWLKRGWALSASWGDARYHRRRIAAGLGLASA